MYQFDGFHGTSSISAEEILDSNYELSVGDDEWIGNGVYFFINGISSKPGEQAKLWAIAQAWDNIERRNKYKRFCVIKSKIEVEDNCLLDLTSEDGVSVLNYLIERFEDKISRLNKRFKYIDGLVINFAVKEGILPIEVVKGNFYIKFAKERIKGFNLRTPNCTICTVLDPTKNIIENHIQSTGDIGNEAN